MLLWRYFHPRAPEFLGYIPSFLSPLDPRPAREQINTAYAHGGGWSKFEGFTLNPDDHSIEYPDDPRIHPIASTELGEETIVVYPHAWVAIIQKDGSFEIARLD